MIDEVSSHSHQIEDINPSITIDISHDTSTNFTKWASRNYQVKDINCAVTVNVAC